MPLSLMSLVTTEPVPITTLLQILTGKIVAFEPIDTLSPTTVLIQRDSSPFAGPRGTRGYGGG